MNISPDQVREATRTAAAVNTADTLPPLRLDEAPGSNQRGRRIRPAWFTPLAAAAAVVLVVLGSVAAGSWLARPGNGQPGRPAAVEQGSPFSGVPAYYVAVQSPSLAVVRATATGAVLARITTRTPFVGVTGAADDRTFVLDAQRQVVGATVRWLGQPAFYLLRLTASGAEQSFSRLNLPVLPAGAVTGLALSPDGSKLAVEMDSGSFTQPGVLEIRVYTLATGAFRSWATLGSTDPVDPYGFTGSGVDASQTISWAADSRTLAFDWMDRSYAGVRVLDTATSPNDLIRVSRLAVIEANFTNPHRDPSGLSPGSKDQLSPCVTDGIISLDGSAIVCGYATNLSGRQTTTGFIRYSARTGKVTSVLGVYQIKGQAGGDISLYWVNSTGRTLIAGSLTPSGARISVIDGQRFTPLPGITSLGAAAW